MSINDKIKEGIGGDITVDNITKEDAIEQLEIAIGIVKQSGEDYFDERDIPILEMAIDSIKKLDTIEKIIDGSVYNYIQEDVIRYKAIVAAVKGEANNEQ